MLPQVELFIEYCCQGFLSEIPTDEDIPVLPISEQTWETWFSKWLEILTAELPPALSYEIGLRLTDDDQIQELNAQYRQQNKPTDVLAFAALETDFPYFEEISRSQPLYLGDIIVSIDTAQRQAQHQQHSLITELAWLTSHGLLHLLGWDHPDEKSLLRMLEKQVTLLESIGIIIDA
ncbi:MAG: rRNA maturation RNase YbeY [Sphaerospermopsis sp. SIO1G1]|nr:rRNA maturation RNase YbeY [Sphaerospermopsis sp. SIO1G1]